MRAARRKAVGRDTERLNWLIKKRAAIRYTHGVWAVRKGQDFKAKSLRRAIDKAMKWHKENP